MSYFTRNRQKARLKRQEREEATEKVIKGLNEIIDYYQNLIATLKKK